MKKKSLNGNLGKNTVLYLLAMIIPRVVSVITLPIFTSYLAPEEYGIFNYTNSISNLLVVFSMLGLNSYYLVSYAKTEDKKLLNGTMFWFLLCWNAIMVFFVGVFAWFLWPVLNISFSFFPYVPLALLTHFFYVTDIIPMRTYRLRGEVHYYLIRVLCKSVLSASLGITLVVFLNMGVLGRYYGELIHNFLFAIVFVVYMYKHSYLKIDKVILKYGLKFGFPLVPSALVTNGIGTVNAILTERLLSLIQLGIYSLGVSVATIVNMVINSISLAIEPEYYLRFEKPGYNQFIFGIKNLQMATAAIICAGCGMFVREAMMLLINKSYWGCWPVVQVLSLSYVVDMLPNVFSAQAMLHSQTRFLLMVSIICFVLLIVFDLCFIPLFGIVGIGIAAICVNFGKLFLLYEFSGKYVLHGMKLYRDFAVIALTASLFFLTNQLNILTLQQTILCKSACFGVFVVVIMLLYGIRLKDIINYIRKHKTFD